MTIAENTRVEYQPDLYVSREEAEAEVQRWLEGNGRLLTITSPPATGKSWLLKRIEAEILKDLPAFWLDVRNFLADIEGSPIGSRVIDPTKLAGWLAQLLQNAKEKCASIPAYDADVEPAVLLEKFAEAIFRCYPGQQAYLLVEGGDEPTEDAWRIIERQVLEPIARQTNWRFIIVLRQEQRLTSHVLRRDEQRFTLGTLPQQEAQPIVVQGREQIEKLRLAELAQYSGLPDTDTILAILPKYPWSHPGLNHFIFLEVKTNHYQRQNWLADGYRLRGLCYITRLPEEYVNSLYTHLNEIVYHLDTGWIPDDLVTHFGWPMSLVWERIEEMRTAGLVENVSRSRFQITDGVREFLGGLSGIKDTTHLIVELKVDFVQFSESKDLQYQFISGLAKFLDISPNQIHITSLQEGSTLAEIELPRRAARQLVVTFLIEPRDLDHIRNNNVKILSVRPASLHTWIAEYFDLSELSGICLDLAIDHQDLSNDTKKRFVIDLIRYCEREGRLRELLDICRQMRPNVDWLPE